MLLERNYTDSKIHIIFKAMMKLVLVRHGKSLWNEKNLFTGWENVGLSQKGEKEAKDLALLLKQRKIIFHQAYTSYLLRAIKTLWIILESTGQEWIPVEKTWKLNERHYGKLQGLNKKECMDQYGSDKVQKWRRSFETLPPLKESEEKTLLRFKNLAIPKGESLEMTQKRVLEFFFDRIKKNLRKDSYVLICAHGNSLRSFVKFFEDLNNQEISEVNIPTAKALIYELDSSFKALKKEVL